MAETNDAPDIAGNYLLDAPEQVIEAFLNLRRTMAQVAEANGRTIECLTENPVTFRARGDLSFIAFAYPNVLFGYEPDGRVITEQRGPGVLWHSAEGKTVAATSAEAGPDRLIEFGMRGAPEHVDVRWN